eukprot:jgi/Galph1/2649/GphlegSOOS_G1283.1
MKIALLSVHGLVRAENVELGRDPDTGGQIVYVLELAKDLAYMDCVEWVQVWTKSIKDDRISPEYGEKVEPLVKDLPLEKACIVRIPAAGSESYIPKEFLWDQLDIMVDSIVQYAIVENHVPDIIHSHYADAGYVASKVCNILQCLHTHVGHSLGRTKLLALEASGMSTEAIEQLYQMARRIESEECCLDTCSLIVTSTADEIESQWKLYDQKRKDLFVVIPPGVDLARFHPPSDSELAGNDFYLFILRNSYRPYRLLSILLEQKVLLMICRPDRKKNIDTMIRIFGNSTYLRQKANLILILGNRTDIDLMDIHTREILTQAFKLIDLYDLYGQVMYPKQHEQSDIPEIYRYVASRGGLFINISWFEPFGLTLLEAAASGLPTIATCHGGAAEIMQILGHGMVVDPANVESVENAIRSLLDDKELWNKLVETGLKNLHRFSWSCHAKQFLEHVNNLLNRQHATTLSFRRPVSPASKVLVCDLDNVLLGDYHSMTKFQSILESARRNLGNQIELWICTGRCVESAIRILLLWGVQFFPKVLITSTGTEVYFLKEAACHLPELKETKATSISLSYNAPELIVQFKGVVSEMDGSQTMTVNPNLSSLNVATDGSAYQLVYEKDEEYEKFLNIHSAWDKNKVTNMIGSEFVRVMRLQSAENQRNFKVSFDLLSENQYHADLKSQIQKCLRQNELGASVWISFERHVDILPAGISKAVALRRAAARNGILTENILSSVSVGADIDLIRGNIRLVVPANHDTLVGKYTKNIPSQVYFAKSSFAQGFIEGICHFRIFEAFGCVIATDEDNFPFPLFPPNILNSSS